MIEMLSAIIGHVSAATTLDIYTHVTNEMQQKAALSIDQGIVGVEPPKQESAPEQPTQDFQPVNRKRRRPGTGCVSQINDHLWEGRYSPTWIDGKKHACNVYGHTEEECEQKLAELILEMKAELAELREALKDG